MFEIPRDCCAKFATGLNNIISHSSKSIWVIKLSFCQNYSSTGETFWQKDSLITHILFELWLIMVFRPVANFAQHGWRMENMDKGLTVLKWMLTVQKYLKYSWIYLPNLSSLGVRSPRIASEVRQYFSELFLRNKTKNWFNLALNYTVKRK